MAAPRVMHGARAKVKIARPGEPAQLVGIFNNISYGLTYDAQPAYILGRFGPVELTYTAQEPVSVTASGWRVINAGPHTGPAIPLLQDLLTHEYVQIVVEDRISGDAIATIQDVRPTAYSTSLVARQQSEITVNFTGLMVTDEFGTASEPGAAEFPPSA